MKTFSLKLLMAGLLAMGLSGTAAIAADFWDSTLSIQGKTLDLGEAGRTTDYAAFTTNGNFSSSTIVSGEVDVEGNVGINGTALSLSNSSINGNVTLKTGGSFNLSGGSQITGSRFQSGTYNTKLTNGANAANTFATTAAGLSSTSNYSASSSISSGNVILSSSNLTITATNSSPVVLNLGTFAIDNGTFTLVGTAMTKYIINVSSGFALSTASKVILSGGLLAGNVVFNVMTTSGAGISGGSTLDGILLASKGNVSLSGGSVVNGEVIAKSIALSGGSKIKKPKKPSL